MIAAAAQQPVIEPVKTTIVITTKPEEPRDNLTNRDYCETQNDFESRLPGQLAEWRIHGTPGYPVTATVGITVRLKGK